MELFHDAELIEDSRVYYKELELEWQQVDKTLCKYSEFEGYSKQLFLLMYNFSCTRCFGYGLPDTMMVPLVDYLNHLPIDTQFGVYCSNT